MMPQAVLLIGSTIVLALFIKAALERLRIPALVGYMGLGFALRLAAMRWNVLTPEIEGIYEFLANIGVICLLFEVGLKSRIDGLLQQLRSASVIWIVNVLLSGFLGYIVASSLLGQGLITSLFVSVALTATSVGVPVALWREAGALNTSSGELMLDVAELDDLSGVVLMAVLFSVVAALKGTGGQPADLHVGKIVGIFLVEFIVFALFCFLFSQFAERHITNIFREREDASGFLLVFIGLGFIIAAIAGLLGFSVAIGAFFAGLVFSRDPGAIRIQASFTSFYEFFTPFFFIGIGLHIDPNALTTVTGLGVILLVAAIMGKLIGTIAPAYFSLGWSSSLLVGVSMVPRAEIAMVIIERGRSLGDWAVSSQAYAAMVLVVIGTCIFASLFLRPMLLKWPQANS
jgi:Kef-type K+ transport system membrane component KefB